MARRIPTYLYIRQSLTVTIPESELGSGKTLTAKICSSDTGDPADIGSLTQTATASASAYTVTFTRTALVADLAAAHLTKRVFLHLDDGAAWHDTYEMIVTDEDPDLLADPT